MLTLVGEKTDKAAMGSRAAQTVELHPERRYKAAFEQYREDNLPEMKKDYPGLRLQQYHDRLVRSILCCKCRGSDSSQTLCCSTRRSRRARSTRSTRSRWDVGLVDFLLLRQPFGRV